MSSLIPPGMLPGANILTQAELVLLPEGSVVLRRSHAQPYFRTAWTLRLRHNGTRLWQSAAWQSEPSDEEFFDGAKEVMVLLYRPVEHFGIGLLDGDGRIADHSSVVVYRDLQAAKHDIGRRAAKNPMAAILQRLDPGIWSVFEGN